VDQCNWVVVIEDNLEVIKHVLSEVEGTADWVLDLGPEGGAKGGEIVPEGTPEQVAGEQRSYTGGYLKELLVNSRRTELSVTPRRKKRNSVTSQSQREAAE
jgi:excinuclease ABC subunit A